MCATCGCSTDAAPRIEVPGAQHDHANGGKAHGHGGEHGGGHVHAAHALAHDVAHRDTGHEQMHDDGQLDVHEHVHADDHGHGWHDGVHLPHIRVHGGAHVVHVHGALSHGAPHARHATAAPAGTSSARPALGTFTPAISTDAVRLQHLEQAVLAKNARRADQNRALLRARHILALNLLSSPGSGKTTLLEQTIRVLGNQHALSVIEGDQETALDAERIRAAGAPVVQVNTGTGCHLDAAMIERAIEQLEPPERSLLLIENVGNLVCPALFDLGEEAKVVIASVTEGEDKPLKYPHIFRASELLVLNKIDLLPWVPFDVDRCIAHARSVNPRIEVLQISALRGDGIDAWCQWIHARLPH
ncbi:MAG TPA: hydrogenase nickel incorporation protein HypB [Myxococcaceae bacterium]|nr:hydrogenase nickel incorporation protein HypB [Myxococcaceae bacterium]